MVQLCWLTVNTEGLLQAAAWRLKTETVSRTLPDALEKSMIPQLHKAARSCIHRLLQDVNALNDTTASDLFGGTPTHAEKPHGNERAECIGHLGQSQHTVCFSSPGNLGVAPADVPQTEMFEACAVGDHGNVVPSQEEHGPSVSLRHGFALSQAHTALDKGDAGEAVKDPASPLLHGFMRPAKGAPVDEGEACVGMTTDETRVSDHMVAEDGELPGRKRKLSEASAGDGDEIDDFAKALKPDQQIADPDDAVPNVTDTNSKDQIDDRSTPSLAERLKALKNQEAIAC